MSARQVAAVEKSNRRRFIENIGALAGRVGFAVTALAGLTLLLVVIGTAEQADARS